MRDLRTRGRRQAGTPAVTTAVLSLFFFLRRPYPVLFGLGCWCCLLLVPLPRSPRVTPGRLGFGCFRLLCVVLKFFFFFYFAPQCRRTGGKGGRTEGGTDGKMPSPSPPPPPVGGSVRRCGGSVVDGDGEPGRGSRPRFLFSLLLCCARVIRGEEHAFVTRW